METYDTPKGSNLFTPHIPTYFDVDPKDCPSIPFNTLEELYAIPALAKCKMDPSFFRFSYSDDGFTLMAEFDDGHIWWVIGFFKNLVSGLPPWKPVYRDKQK